ncbi:MAG: hypothetical protein KJN79_00610 [Gammaproteobacteria bacterium]|nr:hypothetical protein [Gammaproteobacteria bacterium]
MIHCPKCRTAVIKKSGDGKVRIRTRIVAFDGATAEGVCTKCGTTIPLPLELAEPIRKALGRRRLVISRKKVDSGSAPP